MYNKQFTTLNKYIIFLYQYFNTFFLNPLYLYTQWYYVKLMLLFSRHSFFYCFLETHRRLQIKHIIFSCNPFQRDCFKETRNFVPVYFPWSTRLCRFPLTAITLTEYSFLGLKSFIIALFSPLAICNSVVSPPVIRHKSEKSPRGWLACTVSYECFYSETHQSLFFIVWLPMPSISLDAVSEGNTALSDNAISE